MRLLVVVALAVLAAGCATTGGKVAVAVACSACTIIQSTGVCGGPGMRRALPPCEGEKIRTIVNYNAVLRKGAEPIIECR